MYLTLKSSSGTSYLFDAMDNEFYQLSEPDFDDKKSRTELDLPNIERNVIFDKSKIKESIEKNAKTLIVELTEQCNLRCTYCVFDDDYESERSHSSKKIDLAIAKEAISNFSCRALNDAYIVFYGGEPLLEFESVKLLTNYAISVFGDRVKFSFTTNGTPLTIEKLDFLVKNNFLITVSIDGSKKVHDSRRITINGNPSWDKIIANLELIYLRYNDFYKNNIMFNSVLSSTDEISDANLEMGQNKLFKNNIVRFSFTLQNSISNTKYILSALNNDIENIIDSFLSSNSIGDAFVKDRMTHFLQKIAFRKTGNEAQNGKKICVPFSNRTYLRTNGDIQFCERVGSLGRLGNVNELAAYSEKILSDFENLKADDCAKCFAYNFCELCPASFCQDGQFSEDVAKKACDNNRKETLLALNLYISLSEKGYSFDTLA